MPTRPFSERLREAASYAGVEYSQTAIARSLNTSKQTVDRWFADTEPRAAMIFYIADTWNVSARWLATGEGSMVDAPPPGGGLTPDEHVLIKRYRSSPAGYRNSLKTILKIACLLLVFLPALATKNADAAISHNAYVTHVSSSKSLSLYTLCAILKEWLAEVFMLKRRVTC